MITSVNFLESVETLSSNLYSTRHDFENLNSFTYEDELIYVEVYYHAFGKWEDGYAYEKWGTLVGIEGGYQETDYEEDRDFTEEELEELTLAIENTLNSL